MSNIRLQTKDGVVIYNIFGNSSTLAKLTRQLVLKVLGPTLSWVPCKESLSNLRELIFIFAAVIWTTNKSLSKTRKDKIKSDKKDRCGVWGCV